jgi:hypothetical protein
MRANSIAALVAMVALGAPVWAAQRQSAPQESACLLASSSQPENSKGNSGRKAPLNEDDRRRLGDWLQQNRGVPLAEQEKRLERDPYFRKLPPERQEQLLERLKRFNSLPPEKQQRILHRMEMIRQLPPEKQKEIHEIFRQFRALPSDRKRQMRRTLTQMRSMTPEAREEFLKSPVTASYFTEQEMEILRGLNSLGFADQEK